MTEDEMVEWHHRLSGHEFAQTLGDGEGQGSLAAAVHGVAKNQTQLNNNNVSVLLSQFFTPSPSPIPCPSLCPSLTVPNKHATNCFNKLFQQTEQTNV